MFVFILKDEKRTNTSLISGWEDIRKRFMKQSKNLSSVVRSKLIIAIIILKRKRMNKNKKFQKEQLTNEGYVEFVEFFNN